jgi:hypothetical protein
MLDDIKTGKKKKKPLERSGVFIYFSCCAKLPSHNAKFSDNKTKQMKPIVDVPPKTKEKKKKISKEVESPMPKLHQLQNNRGGTAEYLDNDSPEGTPRVDDQIERLAVLDSDKAKLNEIKHLEDQFRKMQFANEKTRVVSKNDVFVSKPGVSELDVVNEQLRLAKIEESARMRIARKVNEDRSLKIDLQKTRAVMKIQSSFRGRIGRKKFILTWKLRQLKAQKEGTGGEWIEVSDKLTGEIWYVNEVTGDSQWVKPEAMIYDERNKSKLPIIMSSSTSEKMGSQSQKLKTKYDKSTTQNNDNNHTPGKNKTLHVSMSLPSLEAVNNAKKAHSQVSVAKFVVLFLVVFW